jgi:CrcB protein
MARHGVNVAVHRLAGQSAPYATAAVNIVGCFVIGLLAGWITAGTIRLSDTGRVFVLTGMLGGFTTFSSFGLDTLTLVESGDTSLALLNVVGQVGVGLASVFVGYWIAR